MIATLLIAAAGQVGFSLPPSPPSPIVCSGAACAMPVTSERYRVERDSGRRPTAKDRAFADDGTYCSVVGARRCTRKARTIFSTRFGE